MIFEWEAAKSARNARERGLPFEVAMAVFDGPRLESPDDRRDYGERRVRAIGLVRNVALVCVYSDRDEARRIISLRVANRKERHAYGEAYPR
ncbi:MAG TPA: BrnT family toxin [Rhizomicrobium sp.]|nr:BrnT family toxin [Rhizomicrobium sp.]